MNYAEESLKRHYEWKGKIEVVTRTPLDSAEALSLAYTPAWPSPVWRSRKTLTKALI